MIRKRGDNTWQIIIYLGRGADGKENYYYETFYSRRKSIVQERERELNKQLITKSGPHRAISTVGDLLLFWLQDLEDRDQAQERTIETYNGHIKKLLTVVGELQLYNLTAFTIQDAMKGQFTNVSSRTRKNYYSTLRTALTNLNDVGICIVDILALSGHADIDSLKAYIHQTKTGLNLLDTMQTLSKSQSKQ